jgi:hypothetical protein
MMQISVKLYGAWDAAGAGQLAGKHAAGVYNRVLPCSRPRQVTYDTRLADLL